MEEAGTSHEKSSQLFCTVDWLSLDFGAVGQYAAIFAWEIAADGRDVRLIGLSTGRYGTAGEAFASGASLETIRLHSAVYRKPRCLHRMS